MIVTVGSATKILSPPFFCLKCLGCRQQGSLGATSFSTGQPHPTSRPTSRGGEASNGETGRRLPNRFMPCSPTGAPTRFPVHFFFVQHRVRGNLECRKQKLCKVQNLSLFRWQSAKSCWTSLNLEPAEEGFVLHSQPATHQGAKDQPVHHSCHGVSLPVYPKNIFIFLRISSHFEVQC